VRVVENGYKGEVERDMVGSERQEQRIPPLLCGITKFLLRNDKVLRVCRNDSFACEIVGADDVQRVLLRRGRLRRWQVRYSR
jgi:hypothetical protein